MAEIMENSEIEIECPTCGGRTKKTAGWMEEHDRLACECGTMISVDRTMYRKENAKAESQRDGFQGLLEKLGK